MDSLPQLHKAASSVAYANSTANRLALSSAIKYADGPALTVSNVSA
jgi:hypothetical protein